jgi:hypothetical protein
MIRSSVSMARTPNTITDAAIIAMTTCQTITQPSRAPNPNTGRCMRSASPRMIMRYQVTINGRKITVLIKFRARNAGLVMSVRPIPISAPARFKAHTNASGTAACVTITRRRAQQYSRISPVV